MIYRRIRAYPVLLTALLLLLGAVPARCAITLLFAPTPGDDLQAAWLLHIYQAKQSIHIACYGISDTAIGRALADSATSRHVEVIVEEDRKQSSEWYDLCQWLSEHGCHVIIKSGRSALHHKMGIFDGRSAILSSGNLSADALKEDDCATLFDEEPAFVAPLEANWETMFRRDFGKSYIPGMELPPLVAPDGWHHAAP